MILGKLRQPSPCDIGNLESEFVQTYLQSLLFRTSAVLLGVMTFETSEVATKASFLLK